MSTSDNGSDARAGLLDRLRGLFGIGAASVRDDIEEALDHSSSDTDFTAQERTLLRNVLGLHELRVHDVMVPRADIIAVSLDASLADVLGVFRTAGHSRLPAHGETLDDARGMVHIRDLVDYLAKAAETPGRTESEDVRYGRLTRLNLSVTLGESRIVRPVLFVPPSMPALDLLVRMQASRTHMALVIDEYGGTDGLVSIEDIMETIVGDIEDEHDLDESPRIDAVPGGFAADARADLETVSAAIGINLETQTGEAGEDVDTIGGLVTAIAGRVPLRGEIVRGGDRLEFEILDADPRRLKRVVIRVQPEPGIEPPNEAA